MKPATTERPFDQKAGSAASRPTGGEELAMAQRAAGAQQLQIFLGKPLMGILVDRVERVHQTIPEGVGIDIERGVDEMRDIGPVIAIGVVET
jgi:hypothetical protein